MMYQFFKMMAHLNQILKELKLRENQTLPPTIYHLHIANPTISLDELNTNQLVYPMKLSFLQFKFQLESRQKWKIVLTRQRNLKIVRFPEGNPWQLLFHFEMMTQKVWMMTLGWVSCVFKSILSSNSSALYVSSLYNSNSDSTKYKIQNFCRQSNWWKSI